ncbi:MAG TPA: YqhA family protein [Nitrospirales bacterium]|nr:YqhA family protein [Nitrospirales bacterium]
MRERLAQAVERGFEKFLWNSRFVVLLAVISSMISSMILFVVATVDVFELIQKVFRYMMLPGSDRTADAYEEFHGDVVGHIIGAIDDFLLATVLFIFALGLYELFISKIDEAEREATTSSRILVIHSLDDLKDRLGKVVLMILIVTFFKNVIHTTFEDPLNILYLAVGILFVALALYFTHKGGEAKGQGSEHG